MEPARTLESQTKGRISALRSNDDRIILRVHYRTTQKSLFSLVAEVEVMFIR